MTWIPLGDSEIYGWEVEDSIPDNANFTINTEDGIFGTMTSVTLDEVNMPYTFEQQEAGHKMEVALPWGEAKTYRSGNVHFNVWGEQVETPKIIKTAKDKARSKAQKQARKKSRKK